MGMEISQHDAELLRKAVANLEKSYSPYSRCKVSCLLVSKASGKAYEGVNIENSSYPCGICAERAALSNAVTAEGPSFRISSVYVVNSTQNIFEPCGMCRQALSEFAGSDVKVVMANCSLSKTVCHSFFEILPYSFSSDDMK